LLRRIIIILRAAAAATAAGDKREWRPPSFEGGGGGALRRAPSDEELLKRLKGKRSHFFLRASCARVEFDSSLSLKLIFQLTSQNETSSPTHSFFRFASCTLEAPPT
jgi:hypothetical protein